MQAILTEKAPKPIGPYSQAILANGFLFLSGQIPIDPKTNAVSLFDGDVGKQTELVLKNIQAILDSQKLSLASVVKTSIFLKDLSQFNKVNEIYAKFFGPHKPARTTVEVSNLPKGAAIEIEAIAIAVV
ncbi:MAG: hypothetical protein A2W61_04355 [Deltaproteobacteria bacterium RIFCSPLOWO2_01_44_7]|nr:MAG: hypothetical protein A2712_01905 [Deltaproteobacteria bacterium RIFCSPHIGHO2_01_FULL_43_49]OGQ15119.1 MAG: hypothetical protein A3D22_03570 [Deltaproteobacteria bacterium RIFCSPHIGHO2_02_FULL_44_53]OGQ27260.1 MAG: hypothetical protein A3D98_02500 [Deltaproteobacteria bacterium RIFCSPHIGHO2_12_FULL_44_21]OGQ31636.1 MAG: hypothetical protein A2979_04730 [Deltaproteobacteria bacterium RIFCSPLOWO2_01_FULL_45_74]OGQ42836.1 MAG: hypothetical protein A3I70_07035 [Deltaproteobacteria bacterium 